MRELRARLTSSEYMEWMAFLSLSPQGEERGDLRMAILARLLANIHRPKGGKVYGVADFMPDFMGRRSSQREMSVEESVRWAQAFAQRHNLPFTPGTALGGGGTGEEG